MWRSKSSKPWICATQNLPVGWFLYSSPSLLNISRYAGVSKHFSKTLRNKKGFTLFYTGLANLCIWDAANWSKEKKEELKIGVCSQNWRQFKLEMVKHIPLVAQLVCDLPPFPQVFPSWLWAAQPQSPCGAEVLLSQRPQAEGRQRINFATFLSNLKNFGEIKAFWKAMSSHTPSCLYQKGFGKSPSLPLSIHKEGTALVSTFFCVLFLM